MSQQKVMLMTKLYALTSLAKTMPKGTRRNQTQSKKAIDDAMNWLRNNDQPADVDDPTAQGLANLAGYPCPAGICLGGEGPSC
jgi:hypothetical protein